MSEAIVIVVPFTEWNDWVIECARHCARLSYDAFVIWLLPNEPPSPEWAATLTELKLSERLRIEPTGPGNPARKRNVAIVKSGAGVFALVDSDAWPHPDWLTKGLALLRDDTAVVTGPNLTPPEDPLARRVPGRVMASPLGFGAAYIRHVPVKRQAVREMPTCNMIIRRQEGLLFREDLDTGEDMMYCSDVRARGGRILYDPEVVVFHHRRRLFRPFLRQFHLYGFDKGHLARSGSDITYLWQAFPALFVLYLAVLALATLLPLPRIVHQIFGLPLLLYAVVIIGESARVSKSIAEFLLTPTAFVTAHLGYGTGYIRGFFSRRR